MKYEIIIKSISKVRRPSKLWVVIQAHLPGVISVIAVIPQFVHNARILTSQHQIITSVKVVALSMVQIAQAARILLALVLLLTLFLLRVLRQDNVALALRALDLLAKDALLPLVPVLLSTLFLFWVRTKEVA